MLPIHDINERRKRLCFVPCRPDTTTDDLKLPSWAREVKLTKIVPELDLANADVLKREGEYLLNGALGTA